MKLLTRHTDYAIRALVYMARKPGDITRARELIDKLRIPDAFSRQLLQKLSKCGILESHRGKEGGFSFKKQPQKIRLLDVLHIFQGTEGLASCTLGGDVCPDRATCPLRSRIKSIEAHMVAELSRTTIASLLKETIS
jgi:Rrf2 family protein